MNESKAREFWIDAKETECRCGAKVRHAEERRYQDSDIHVREVLPFERLAADIAKDILDRSPAFGTAQPLLDAGAICEHSQELERLRAENERLSKEYDVLAKNYQDQIGKYDRLNIELTKLREAAAGLREALVFYASRDNWMGYHDWVDAIRDDHEKTRCLSDGFPINLGGRRAREALAKFDAAMKGGE